MALAFSNHPLTVINPEFTPKLLLDNKTKIQLFEEIGLDILGLFEFSYDFMRITPEDFILKVLKYYNATGVIIGYNYRFGYKNLGDVDFLQTLSKIYGFHLHVIEPVEYEGYPVSSSRIRNAITEGDISKANIMLTRSYKMSGKVIMGKQIGRTIGFPTINLDYDKGFVIPRGGVYITKIEYLGVFYKGITNVGYNPTFEDNKLSVETFLFDFNKDIYNEVVDIYFIERIRDEKKFPTMEALRDQIEKDKSYAEEQNV